MSLVERLTSTSNLRSLERAGERAGALAREHAPLLLVLALGLVLRIYVLVIYQPAYGGLLDGAAYLWSSSDQLFSDELRMAGYPVFLRVTRWIYPDLTFLVAFQHLLGLLTAVLLYASVRRVSTTRWLATIPAAAVAFSVDQVVLEHSIMTETLFTFLAVAGVCAAVFAAWAKQPIPLLVASGLALGCASVVRTVAIPLLVIVLVWLLVVRREPVLRRLRSASSFVLPAIAVVLCYALLQGIYTGYWGLSRASGWAIYTRVAPIADCREFTPPEGTQMLCEPTPVFATDPTQARPGPGYYQFVGGPAIDAFGNPYLTDLQGNEAMGRFARAVLLHQPLAYLGEVSRDLVRYISPTFGYDRPYGGAPPEELDISRRAPEAEQVVFDAAIAAGYHDEVLAIGGGVNALQDLQAMLRVSGLALLILLVVGILAVVLGSGAARAAACLFLLAAVVQAAVPVLTLSWGFRYSVPCVGFLATAAALGIFAIASRIAGDRRARPA